MFMFIVMYGILFIDAALQVSYFCYYKLVRNPIYDPLLPQDYKIHSDTYSDN